VLKFLEHQFSGYKKIKPNFYYDFDGIILFTFIFHILRCVQIQDSVFGLRPHKIGAGITNKVNNEKTVPPTITTPIPILLEAAQVTDNARQSSQ
jgi:hypothetical protein